MSKISRKDMRCGVCCFCIKDDGQPYCVLKDLCTNVEPDDICDETNSYDEYYFSMEKTNKERRQ